MSEEQTPKDTSPKKPRQWSELNAVERLAVSTVISENAARIEMRVSGWTLVLGTMATSLLWKAFSPELYWVTTAFVLLGVYKVLPKLVGETYFFSKLRSLGYPDSEFRKR